MPNKEDILSEQTFKDVDELEKRIYYTLTDKEKLATFRIAKTLALLIKGLHDKGILSIEEIEEFLFECVM
jgi:hypothetical protein